MDSNHRPLPCQGSALDQLSYGPTCGAFNSTGREQFRQRLRTWRTKVGYPTSRRFFRNGMQSLSSEAQSHRAAQKCGQRRLVVACRGKDRHELRAADLLVGELNRGAHIAQFQILHELVVATKPPRGPAQLGGIIPVGSFRTARHSSGRSTIAALTLSRVDGSGCHNPDAAKQPSASRCR
jgi:hypothetical protein